MLAELCGVGMTADSKSMISPDIDGAREVMRLALEDARLAPSDLGYLNAHGAATIVGDRNEAEAIRKTFGRHACDLPVSATKSMYGHPLGASGAIEAAICALAMTHGFLPGTANLTEPDPEIALSLLPPAGRCACPRAVLNTAFGFGGINSTLVLTSTA